MTAAMAPFGLRATGAFRTIATLDVLLGKRQRRAPSIVSATVVNEITIECPDAPIVLSWRGVEPPVWLKTVAESVRQFVALEINWDGYGGIATTFDAAAEGLRILSQIMLPEDPAPSVVPGGDGSIQFEWHTVKADFEFAVGAAGNATAYFASRDGHTEVELDEHAFDVDVLDALLRQI